MYKVENKTRILITGASGFIGSNLVKQLLELGNHYVIGLDNFDDFYSKKQKLYNIKSLLNHDCFKFIEGDILDINRFHEINDINVIIHLAGKAGVRPSIQNPLDYYESNVKGTQILLEYAKVNKIRQFIFASSSSVYGVNINFPWKEGDNLYPISPYASTKLSCEMIGHVYSQLYGIRFLALRFFTVYGPGQRPDLAINKFFHAIMHDEPLTVFGDGSTSRDYTYVNDIVNGILSAVDYNQSNFEIINLGNSKLITLDFLINTIEDICNKKALINRFDEQPGDVRKTCADITKARDLLNYEPKTGLKEGLLNFFNWWKEYNQF